MNLNLLDSGKSAQGAQEARDVDTRGLEADLRKRVEGEVRFDTGTRAAYSTDASNYRHPPICVVLPRHADDVLNTLTACRTHGAPVLGRAGGTSLAGQCCNTAVIIDCSKYMNRIINIDPAARTARVQPGVVLDQLRHATEEPHKLTYGPDPATHNHCCFGGMLGNNSCGIHSVQTGRTVDNTLALNIATYDGERLEVGETPDAELERILAAGGRRADLYRRMRALRDKYADLIRQRYPDIPRRVSGYNLPSLLPENGFHVARALVGSESTLAYTLEATVRLVDWWEHRALLVVGYPSVYDAADHVPKILEYGPIGLEGIDHKLVDYMTRKHLHPQDIRELPEGKGWLLVEFSGDTDDDARHKAERARRGLESTDNPPVAKVFARDDADKIWEIRESGLSATAFVPGMPSTWPGWEDAAMPPDQVGDYLRGFRKLLDEHGYDCALYGHFGDGCIHCRIDFDLKTAAGLDNYRRFVGRAAELVLAHGGSLSGEHGDGQARGELLPKMYGVELVEAFRELKRIWDPKWRMNPGKVVDANPIVANLRLGADWHPTHVDSYFAYPDDQHSFTMATERCVGVGKCRRRDEAFMCPSFMATWDEEDTTRGRARALFEMLHGGIIDDGWRSKGVYETLDLCIGCKGCKKECPVHVDMATYKAEFLAHHYAGRLRPAHNYSMGMIGTWARLAQVAPPLANFFGQTAPFAGMLKALGGIDKHRKLPKFAKQTFTGWFERRGAPPHGNGETVVLLPDVFNDHFFPGALRAAVVVLEQLGLRVVLPPKRLPAIRPRIHYGMLKAARRELRSVAAMLGPLVRKGTAVVGLEPSTISVYRDELPNLLPGDVDGQRLTKNCYLLSEFLIERDMKLPRIGGQAIFHGHCHQKAVLNADAAREVLRRVGITFDEPEQGCCGMAGSFGYERGEHYQVSMQIAERNLYPAVRAADESTLLVADGFSCREQIHHAVGRRPLHIAELLHLGMTGQPRPPGDE